MSTSTWCEPGLDWTLRWDHAVAIGLTRQNVGCVIRVVDGVMTGEVIGMEGSQDVIFAFTADRQ